MKHMYVFGIRILGSSWMLRVSCSELRLSLCDLWLVIADLWKYRYAIMVVIEMKKAKHADTILISSLPVLHVRISQVYTHPIVPTCRTGRAHIFTNEIMYIFPLLITRLHFVITHMNSPVHWIDEHISMGRQQGPGYRAGGK